MFKDDPLYYEKFYVVKNKKIIDQLAQLDSDTKETVLSFLRALDEGNPNEYLVVNQDEPYAEKVWELIKENERKEIVAFIGRAGSGKDYQSKLLQEKGYHKIAFADALRDIAFTSMGINANLGSDVYEELKRNNCITIKQGDIFNTFTFRTFLEQLGTQGIRKYDPDFWTKSALKTIEENKYRKVCISDMRFLNEYKLLRNFAENNDYELTVIFCDYHSDRYQDSNEHESAKLSNWLANHKYRDLQKLEETDFELAEKDLK